MANEDDLQVSDEEAIEELDAPPALKNLAKEKLNKAFLVRRELKKLPEVLTEGEHVVNLARGEYDGREGLMAVTDHRVMFLEQGLVRHRFEDFRFDKITSVQQSTGVLSGEVTIHSAGTKHKISDVHPKRRAVEIADYVRSKMGEVAAASASPQSAPEASDVADQLRKLGELRDAGVLTPEEFDSKKTDLLGRM